MSAGSHAPAPRIASVDLLRGLVMIVMALDHSRDFFLSLPYAPEDLTQASPALFFTRWITHFCAPAFVFLAGVSAWLYARNTRATPAQLSRFLWTRALWLFFIEIAVFSASWRFSFDWTVLQVIWAIGCSLLLLSIVCRFSWRVSVVLGLAIVLGHNLLDAVEPSDFGRFALLWNLLHVPRFDFAIGDHPVWILYPVLPWMGVLLLGYAWGAVMTRDVTLAGVSWQRLSIAIGSAAIVLFALLRGFNLYGDPDPWQVQPRGALFSFLDVLNTTKYPPSLAFLLMTLGPALVLMPLLEHWRGKLAQDRQRVRPRAVLLLCPALPTDSRAVPLVGARLPGRPVGCLLPAAAGRVRAFARARLSRVGVRSVRSVLAVPLVRRPQAPAPRLVAELSLTAHWLIAH